jgi:hypothetical protein
MSCPFIKYDSVAARDAIMTWGQTHSIDVEATLLLHLEQKFSACTVSVLGAETETDVLMLKLHSEQWKEDKEFGLTAEGSLVW